MADTTHRQTDNDLAALTDQCVMCGLCLPHCPTYALDQHEAESPRGRIALARRWASGDLQPSGPSIAHLDHCLACRACEAVCPSHVRYEMILVQTRALLRPLRPPPGRLGRWLADPFMLTRLAKLGAVVRAARWLPHFAGLIPRRSPLHRLLREMPRMPPASPVPRRSVVDPGIRGRIILFPGCVASVFDRDTLAAGQGVLEALGYEVVRPRNAVCCGALALHAGEGERAARIALDTREALLACSAPTVLVSASGCLGSLRDSCASTAALQVADILGFVAADEGLSRLRFRPLPERAALHVPCTQKSVASGSRPVRALLGRIPGLQLLELPERPGCCGAAGSYFIEQADRADRLRAEKLDQIALQSPDLLLTTNIGCRIFLGNGLDQRALAIPVLHPLTLLARQLEIP